MVKNRIIVSPVGYYSLSDDDKFVAITIKLSDKQDNLLSFVSRRGLRNSQYEVGTCLWEIDLDRGYGSEYFLSGQKVKREIFIDDLRTKYPEDFEWLMWNQEIFDGHYNGTFTK